MATISSKEFSWKNLKLVLGGRLVTGFREVTLEVSQEVYQIFASGNRPHAMTEGNMEVSGQIELLQSEVEALTEAAQQVHGPNATILDLELDSTMGFAGQLTDRMKFHGIYALRFTKLTMGMKQNDSNMNVVLPFKAMDVKFNI